MAILSCGREHFQQVCDLFPELSEQLSKVSQERIHRVEMLKEEKRQGTDGVQPPGLAPRRGSWASKTSSNTSLRKAARLLFARLGRATPVEPLPQPRERAPAQPHGLLAFNACSAERALQAGGAPVAVGSSSE